MLAICVSWRWLRINTPTINNYRKYCRPDLIKPFDTKGTSGCSCVPPLRCALPATQKTTGTDIISDASSFLSCPVRGTKMCWDGRCDDAFVGQLTDSTFLPSQMQRTIGDPETQTLLHFPRKWLNVGTLKKTCALPSQLISKERRSTACHGSAHVRSDSLGG